MSQMTASAGRSQAKAERTLWQRLSPDRTFLGLVFMIPAAAILMMFLADPLFKGVWLSFTDAKIGR